MNLVRVYMQTQFKSSNSGVNSCRLLISKVKGFRVQILTPLRSFISSLLYVCISTNLRSRVMHIRFACFLLYINLCVMANLKLHNIISTLIQKFKFLEQFINHSTESALMKPMIVITYTKIRWLNWILSSLISYMIRYHFDQKKKKGTMHD